MRWTGDVSAELTPAGLLLRIPGEADYLAPLGCGAEWPCSTYLKFPCDDRIVTFTLAQPSVDQVTLARDLAAWLDKKKYCLYLDEYALPTYPRLLALACLLVPLAAIVSVLRGIEPFAEVRWLVIAAASMFAVAGLLFMWSFAGYPAVRTRVMVMLIVVVLGNLGVGTLWLHHTGDLLELRAMLPGGPGGPIPDDAWTEFVEKHAFAANLPGNPHQDVANLDKVKDAYKLYVVERPHTIYAIGHVDLPGHWNEVTRDRWLDDARNGLIPKIGNGVITSSQKIVHQGLPGREYKVVIPKQGNLIVRHIVVGSRLYVLLAGAPRYEPTTPDVQRFFSSFRVIK